MMGSGPGAAFINQLSRDMLLNPLTLQLGNNKLKLDQYGTWISGNSKKDIHCLMKHARLLQYAAASSNILCVFQSQMILLRLDDNEMNYKQRMSHLMLE